MKKTLAIPALLLSPYLNDQQREERAKYGDKAMTDDEILERQQDEARAAAKKIIRQAEKARNDIIKQLDALDLKAIRPLIEGNQERLAEIEAQKAALRAML